MNDPLIEFIRGYREPTATAYVAQELERLGRLGAEWPRAPASQWMQDIRGLVEDGKLVERDGVLSVPVAEVVTQRTLF